ncbi:hypothetical protein OG500_21440 [Kitasatospora sp. NBC_01250]|uniref:hypothetical protein n=1 Tax=Kitasatospora sp. NBC_01250 TaxID=2903571 RepID=UPI002E309852|nr:hypothetical protein [Kitasatospora sp. NBC_01250]
MHTELSARSDSRGDPSENVVEQGAGNAAGSGSAPAHRTEVSERGSFAHAACSCGWFAPARRSRDRARRDAAEHLAQPDG